MGSNVVLALTISTEWLGLLVVLGPVVVYVVTVKVLTDRSVKNIEEQWTKLDDIKDRIGTLDSRIARIEGAHAAKGCFPPRPPAK